MCDMTGPFSWVAGQVNGLKYKQDHIMSQLENKVKLAIESKQGLSPAEYETLASKYRAVASSSGLAHEHTAYYSALADEFTKMAQASASQIDSERPLYQVPTIVTLYLDESDSEGDSDAPLDSALPQFGVDSAHVKIHQKLALEILARGPADLHRAFSIWAVWRMTGRTWLTRDEFFAIADQTEKSARTVAKWLDEGEGIFWSKQWVSGKLRIWLIGKGRVLDRFGLVDPGRVMAVPTGELLSPKLQVVRASLYSLWVGGPCRWGARDTTINRLTGIETRTQQNYDKLRATERQPVYGLWNFEDEQGRKHQAKQLPNRYYSEYQPYYPKTRGKRFGLRTTGYNVMLSGETAAVGQTDDKTRGRILYDNMRAGIDKAQKLAKQGIEGVVFGAIEPRQRFNKQALFVKPLLII